MPQNRAVHRDVRRAWTEADRAVDLLRELDRRLVFVGQGPGVIAQLQDGSGTVLAELDAGQVVRLVEALER